MYRYLKHSFEALKLTCISGSLLIEHGLAIIGNQLNPTLHKTGISLELNSKCGNTISL